MIGAFKRIIVMMIERANPLGIEPQIAHLHEGAEHARAGKLLDGEPNGLGGRCEPPISERSSRPGRALGNEKFRSRGIIEIHDRLSVCSGARDPIRNSQLGTRWSALVRKQLSARFNRSRDRVELLFLVLPFWRSRHAITLSFALLGFLMQLLELFRLFGTRLTIAFRALLTVIGPECHGRS